MVAQPLSRSPGEDHLGATLVLALIVHALIITQLHFNARPPPADDPASSLDVVLVQWASEAPPEEADFIAQANQRGGGEAELAERPASPPPATPAGEPAPARPADATLRQAGSVQDFIAARDERAELAQSDQTEQEPATLPDARTLLNQTRELVQSRPDPLAENVVVPKRPRRKFITANTREHLYAAYMRAWVGKVERVGNMNYPEEARRRNLEGSLVLSVDVLADGSIERVQVLRSSGFELLDEAAVRIVRLAAPYAELPPEIRKETDILTITRTWQFSASGGMN
ncbi:MAG: energy transducer TonB [Wenzhouxiangellaceae bacterium]|nr:energy transducer TonB [Wenzhouxiangellaceae bacterium]